MKDQQTLFTEKRHPIKVVARRTGLSPEVLRVWEKRYAVVEPGRTKTARRLYSDADIERLRILRQATLLGRRIGEISGLTTEALAAQVKEDREATAEAPRPELNGKTLAEVADERGLTVPETVREIMLDGNASVMNRELYDVVNTRYLATMPWMMTCTDGATPTPGADIVHPRVYGAFPKKIRDFVDRDEAVARMQRALDFFVVEGVHTTIPLHQRILQDRRFLAGQLSTRFMERFLAD